MIEYLIYIIPLGTIVAVLPVMYLVGRVGMEDGI